ncbi:MAG: hypothetical protein ACLP0J_25050 [Solirubrobacteraceae bacterium]|jgi:hypothetical protein
MNELLRATNHHSSATTPIGERPGRHIGYFENSYAEQFVFVHEAGEPHVTLYAGDVDWEPCVVSDADGVPDVGALILKREERAFVCACWIATAPARGACGRFTA